MITRKKHTEDEENFPEKPTPQGKDESDLQATSGVHKVDKKQLPPLSVDESYFEAPWKDGIFVGPSSVDSIVEKDPSTGLNVRINKMRQSSAEDEARYERAKERKATAKAEEK